MLNTTNDLEKCYQLLGISHSASLDDLKTAYRLLARKSHPDLNPADRDAHQRFIALDRAYRVLLETIGSESNQSSTPNPSVTVKVTRKSSPPPASTPPLSKEDVELKSKSIALIHSLLKQQEFLKAICSIEGLVRKLPEDLQACQCQGMVYARFGEQLIARRELNKARIYLKKALKSDPHNRQLWQEVNRAFDRIERLI